MASVCIYLQIHQPYRVRNYRIFDIGTRNDYFSGSGENNRNNEWVLKKVAKKSYAPTAEVLRELLEKHPTFSFALSFSGIVLDQLEAWAPDVLKEFQEIVKSGRVEILGETYYHSLAFFYSEKEFERQVDLHKEKIQKLFGVTPTVFRNTELAYRDDLAKWAEKKGYTAILAEGWSRILGWRSANFTYRPEGTKHIALLLKNYQLSDDIAFRFGQRSWESWPLSAETFGSWIHSVNGNGETVNLFMDFETFGEHQWEDTGIFHFLRQLPVEVFRHPDNSFKTPSETAKLYSPKDVIQCPDILTWADTDRDLTAWVDNDMQKSAIKAVYALEGEMLKTKNNELLEAWRRLQTSDHFYYMCTKWSNDGDVHAYFSPYNSPYEAFIAYMNALKDLSLRMRSTRVHNSAQGKMPSGILST